VKTRLCAALMLPLGSSLFLAQAALGQPPQPPACVYKETRTAYLDSLNVVPLARCEFLLIADWPQPAVVVNGEFDITGWAVDRRSSNGIGIDQVSLWLDGEREQGRHLGDVTDFQPRPDIAALLGPNFLYCGYSLRWDSGSVSNGSHTLYVYTYSPTCGWHGLLIRSFTVRQCDTILRVDWPQPAAIVSGEVDITGWTVDRRSTSGAGIDRVNLWLDGGMNRGRHLGDVTDFQPRPDIAVLLGAGFLYCGYELPWDSQAVGNGPHTLYVYSHSPDCGWHGPAVRSFTVRNRQDEVTWLPCVAR